MSARSHRWPLGVVLCASAAHAGPLPPPGWRRPPDWQARCAERLELARAALGRREAAFDAAPNVALVSVDEATRRAELKVAGFTVRATFVVGETPAPAPAEARWSDRLLDTKNAQRLLMRTVRHGDRSLAVELATDPAVPLAALFVRTFKRAADGCATDLKTLRDPAGPR